jgi:hypothetical protein
MPLNQMERMQAAGIGLEIASSSLPLQHRKRLLYSCYLLFLKIPDPLESGTG